MQNTKSLLASITAIAAGLMMTGDVVAQPPGGDGGRGQRPNAEQMLERFDANKDGTISASELAEVPERVQGAFKRADADGDGAITKAEMEKMMADRGGRGGPGRSGAGGEGRRRGGPEGAPEGREGRGGPGGEFRGPPGGGPGGGGREGFMRAMMERMPIVATLDADKDGEISEAEIKNAVAALQSLDKNKDGKLTSDEIMPTEFGGRGGRGGRAGTGGRGGRGGRPGGPDGEGGDRPQRPNRPE